jgi:hypothetical protein
VPLLFTSCKPSILYKGCRVDDIQGDDI